MSAHGSRGATDQVVAETASDGRNDYIAVHLYSNSRIVCSSAMSYKIGDSSSSSEICVDPV
jgi:hypothetical protein